MQGDDVAQVSTRDSKTALLKAQFLLGHQHIPRSATGKLTDRVASQLSRFSF